MKGFAVFFVMIMGLPACSAGMFQSQATKTAEAPIVVPPKPEPVEKEEEPKSLLEDLQASLEFIQSTHGDGSFDFRGLEISNMETILTDALDFVESEVVIDSDLDAEIATAAGFMDIEEAYELYSKFTVNYGKKPTPPPPALRLLAAADTVAAMAAAADKLFGSQGSYERRVAVMNRVALRSAAAAAQHNRQLGLNPADPTIASGVATNNPNSAIIPKDTPNVEDLAGGSPFTNAVFNFERTLANQDVL